MSMLMTALFLICGTAQAENEEASIPDSLLTEDHVYNLTFTDMETALRIVGEMRTRHMQPAYELDMLEGDLWCNNRYFDKAIPLYLKALQNDSAKNYASTHMSLLHRMISCYDGKHDDANTTKYVKLLLEEARKNNDKPMESIAMFNMGKLTYYQEDKELGYKLIKEAIDIMEHSDYDYKYDNLRYNYNTLLIMQQRDELYEDALETLAALESVVTASTDNEPEIANLAQKELKTLYAQQAIFLRKLKRLDEAEAAYKKWKAVAPGYTADDYIIAPYLIGTGRINKAIDIYNDYEAQLESRGDTISYHMRSLLRSMGMAYYRIGQYKKSAEYFSRLSNVTDSLKVREQNSSAQELATLYETHKKENELIKRDNEIKVRNAWLLGTVTAIAMLLILMFWQIRHAKLTKRKNIILAANIQKLLAYKNELESIEQQKELETGKPHSSGIPGNDCNSSNQASDYETENRQIFATLDNRVNQEQLFLNPDLTRDDLMRIAHIDKNRYAQILQQHGYTNTPDYINRKRLEYATNELEIHPEYTINAIAESCGLPNVPTFNRLFRKHFGMTPTEFRKALKHK